MKRFISCICGSLVALTCSVSYGQQDFDVLPIEMFGCSFIGGQDISDLESPNANFNEWADSEGITELTSLMLIPHFYSTELEYEIIGMDIWEDGAAFGDGVSRMQNDPESYTEILEVVDCPAHVMYALVGVKPPENGLGNGGLFEFSDCRVKENRTADEGIAAVAAIGEMMSEWNVGDAQGVLFPVAGETPDADYTFKWITYYPSVQAFGTVFDHFVSGGVQRAGAIIDPVMDCDISRMYDVQTVRESAAAPQ